MFDHKLRIALLIPTDGEWHRDVLKGIAHFAAECGGWNVTLPKMDSNGEVFIPADWNGDGIIGRITSSKLERQVLEKSKYNINVSWLLTETEQIPKIICCATQTAIVAAEFLLAKQHHHYGFVGFPPWQNYSSEFENSLADHLGKKGFKLHTYELNDKQPIGIKKEDLVKWLIELPKPIAIIVWSSAVGKAIAEVCENQEIKLPESVSILTIDNDAVWSALARIPLSYVDQNPWRIGNTAAQELAAAILSQTPPKSNTLRPVGVIERISTAASATNDALLNKALICIQENLAEVSKGGKLITVSELAKKLDISRRVLEIRFKSLLECTPSSYLKQMQLNNVAQLLRTTSMTLAEIASKTGFAYPEVLARSFKRQFGVTPMDYRQSGQQSDFLNDDCQT